MTYYSFRMHQIGVTSEKPQQPKVETGGNKAKLSSSPHSVYQSVCEARSAICWTNVCTAVKCVLRTSDPYK